jgi:neutral ceramidase
LYLARENKFMKRSGIREGKILTGLVILFFISSCAVVRTPYPTTDYYRKTVSRLNSIKSKSNELTDSLYAGFSKSNITPGLKNSFNDPILGKFKKVPLAGFGQRKGKPATGVHDSIFVKAIALRAGGQKLVVVSADLLIMPPNIIDSVVVQLSRSGINRSQLFFSATHTHSSLGGWGYGLVGRLFSGKENRELQKWLVRQISRAVLLAIDDLRPARIGSGRFDASSYTRNRLTGETGEKNNDFNFIVIEQTGGRKAIIGSFSAHATTLNEKNLEISGDYPGYWERKTESSSADLAVFCGGSMGSQSYTGRGTGFENSKYIGESLADSLTSHLGNVIMNKEIDLSAISLKIELPDYHLRLTTKINLTTGLSKELMPYPQNVYLQALRINNSIWIFTPGDFNGESALHIKNSLAAKGYDANILGYNGSYVGYILPGKYFYMNNYETKLMGWFGPTMGDYTVDLINQICDRLIRKVSNN